MFTFFQFPTAIPGIIYAFLGTSRHLNVAPGAPLSLLMGQAISGALRDNPDNPSATISAIITITTLQAGLISFLVGLFRLGFIDVILSRALMRGFMTAIAIVIMVFVINPFIFAKSTKVSIYKLVNNSFRCSG